jgi:hypothetical protein
MSRTPRMVVSKKPHNCFMGANIVVAFAQITPLVMLLYCPQRERRNTKGGCILSGVFQRRHQRVAIFFLPKDVPQLFISVKKEDERYRSVFFEIYVLVSLFTDAD